MKKRFSLLLFFFLTALCSKLEAVTLSPDARISVLTCAPGSELYSLFGHSAVRVEDPAQNIDLVFNYGTFDFNTPHFYLKYAQGLLPYQLSITSYQNFISSYIEDNRSVYSQLLKLNPSERQKLFDLLWENHQPANRTYLYNFLFDNCSTRVRDIIAKSTNQPIRWEMPNTGKSFWNLLDEYLYRLPWIKWGIHTILGQSGSRQATPYQYMFLPDYLLKGLDAATVGDHRLTDPALTLFRAEEPLLSHPWYFSPCFVFSAAVLLLIFLLQKYRSKKLLIGLSALLFTATGLIGLLLIFLSFFTKHPMTSPNLNLIWANPLNLIVLGFLARKHFPFFIRGYLNLYLFLLLLGIPVWFFASPAVPLASLPLLILMAYLCVKLKRIKS